MNSVPNNDSKQCTESKLGWVHRVHTLNPSCAPQAVRKAPCRGARWGRPRLTFDRRCRACARRCRACARPCRACTRPCRACARPCHCPHARASTPCRNTVLRAGPRRVAVLLAVSRISYVVSWRMLVRIAALLHAMSQPVLRYT